MAVLPGLSVQVQVFLPGATRVSLLREIGRGSFGRVFEGTVEDLLPSMGVKSSSNTLPRRYAIKTFNRSGAAVASDSPPPNGGTEQGHVPGACLTARRPTLPISVDDDALLTAFRSEVESLLMLEGCPNSVRLLGVGATDEERVDSLFLALEFLEGPSLLEVVKSAGPACPAASRVKYSQMAALRWSAGLAAALEHLHHSLGMLHRDLKLANVCLDSADDRETAEACLLDLGLAMRITPALICHKSSPDVLGWQREDDGFGSERGSRLSRPLQDEPTRRCTISDEGLNPALVGGDLSKCGFPDDDLPRFGQATSTGPGRKLPDIDRELPVQLDVVSQRMPRRSTVSSGLAITRSQQQLPAGTLLYTAPELRIGASHSPSTDVYSLGLVIYELFHHMTLDQAAALAEVAPGGLSQASAALRKGWRPLLDTKLCPPPVCDLISCCWSFNPHERPSARGVHQVLREALAVSLLKDSRVARQSKPVSITKAVRRSVLRCFPYQQPILSPEINESYMQGHC